MRTPEECLLMYRRNLRQLLSDYGIASNPAVTDEWILKKVAELASKTKKDKEPKHTCGFCGKECPTIEALYDHQKNEHDPDGIMFSEIGLPK